MTRGDAILEIISLFRQMELLTEPEADYILSAELRDATRALLSILQDRGIFSKLEACSLREEFEDWATNKLGIKRKTEIYTMIREALKGSYRRRISKAADSIEESRKQTSENAAIRIDK